MIDKNNLEDGQNYNFDLAKSDFNDFKMFHIKESLNFNDRLSLKTMACSNNGFICNELRVQVWCKLANIDPCIPKKQLIQSDMLKRNVNYRQVILDVERSLKRFPPSVQEAQRIQYQDSLTEIIIKVLDKNPSLYYYQGYHDICLTFLLIMDEDEAFTLINEISLSHLKYFMERTMNTTSNLLEIIYLILSEEDKELYDYLIKSEVGTIFSLSWVITWFSHVLNDLDDILRMFDFFISTHFLMPIYMTVSILLYKKEEILLIDCDMASMHKFLTNIPQKKLPIDKLVRDSLILSVKYPPEDTLRKQKEIEHYSLSENEEIKILSRSCQFLRRNVFSITVMGFLTAIVLQFCFDYFIDQ